MLNNTTKSKRTRIITGKFVASSNHLKNIMGRRLDVSVRYVQSGFSNRIISMNTIGIREYNYPAYLN
jgi:hypothetical protein